MKRPPRIGITSYPRVGEREAFSIPTGYVDGVRAAGGLAFVLPPGDADPARVLEHLDGVVLVGGGDISPARYGGRPHETIYEVSEDRDHFEMELARAALERPVLPMLCICRGMQILNVVLGGTLHAHLPDLGSHVLEHRLPPKLPTRHPARIEPGSRLAEILGADEIDCCSWHHQAIDRLGRDLRAVGWAADGVIEAIEHVTHPFCIGVQWHPEMQLDEEGSRRLFRAFVDRCRAGTG